MPENRKLLVVDDELVVCQSCKRILERRGWEVDVSTDSRQGLTQAIEKTYSAVLLDLQMPQMDGFQFLEALRQKKPDLPVVIMTGHADALNAAAANSLRASACIAKPFLPEEIIHCLGRFAGSEVDSPPRAGAYDAELMSPPIVEGTVRDRQLHVVVCVKMVPDTTQVKIDPITNTLIRKDVPFITNPFDTRAVEAGLRVKDNYEARVTAVSMGPPAAEAVLRRALSLGVDEAVLLSDMAFGGADTLATSKVLAEAIAKLDQRQPVDLIICGQQTIDGDTAQVGPGIACRLGLSQLTLVDEISRIDQQSRRIRVRRRLEQYCEIVEAQLPALLTVVREINTPRYPTVPGRLAAAEAPVATWTNQVLKLETERIGLRGSPTQVKRIFAPQRAKGETVQGAGEHQPAAMKYVLEKLVDWGVVRLRDRSTKTGV